MILSDRWEFTKIKDRMKIYVLKILLNLKQVYFTLPYSENLETLMKKYIRA